MIIFSFVMLFITGCTTAPNNSLTNEPIEKPAIITEQELKELKSAVKQWHKARKGIERLLKLENEITYLVKHIDIINSKAIAQQNSPSKGYSTRSKYKTNNTTPAANINKTQKKSYLDDEPRNFALQLASVDSMDSARTALKEIKIKAAPLFRAQVLTNVEVAKVHDKTYYRLKVSSYEKLQTAQADCKIIKQYKLDCIVTNYTQNPL